MIDALRFAVCGIYYSNQGLVQVLAIVLEKSWSPGRWRGAKIILSFKKRRKAEPGNSRAGMLTSNTQKDTDIYRYRYTYIDIYISHTIHF